MKKKLNWVKKILPEHSLEDYRTFDQIDGNHPWRQAAPASYVNYDVRLRRKGKIVYFNYALAKEMNLISYKHKHKMNPSLEKKLLETFSIQIINEYDIEKKKRFRKKDIKSNKYIAMRYLQLQHKCKFGTTSGDGRSIWHGQVRNGREIWDVSSCGTGVTRLSPGFVEQGKAIKTGSKNYSYGSGRAGLDECILDSIFSAVLYGKGIETERVLVVIGYPDKSAIKVRVAKNLLRPSHFFNNLKQNKLNTLSSSINFFIEQQIKNRKWPIDRRSPAKYDQLLDLLTNSYAKLAACFEHLYIFFWAEWDGDNMLAEGGIVDYGSIRQFGLCHHRYRYDDGDRWSTGLLQQRKKIRYVLQVFAQLVDYLNTGEKKNILKFSNHSSLKKFDRIFIEEKYRRLLARMGLFKKEQEYLIQNHKHLLSRFVNIFYSFERKTKRTKATKTNDGINCEAIYDIKSIFDILPVHFYNNNELMSAREFLKHIKSEYTSNWALEEKPIVVKKVIEFQNYYLKILKVIDKNFSKKNLLVEIKIRLSNSREKIPLTGDAAIHIVEKILRKLKKLKRDEINTIIDEFIASQCKDRKILNLEEEPSLSKSQEKLLEQLSEVVYEHRYSI